MEYCKNCIEGLVKNSEGKFEECKCVTKNRMKQYLAPFLNAPKVNKAIVQETDLLLSLKCRKIFIPKFKDNFYKTILAHYLAASKLYNSYTLLHTYEIIDVYLGKLPDVTLYDYNTKVMIILHGFVGVPNKREYEILQQFVKIHEDKIIIIYTNSSNSAEVKSNFNNFKIYNDDSGRKQ